ncbi:c-type cytochrome [Mariniflexile jejuense]|uniref:C-type cytochrome n=1 Tax=Mariniflexile jejuense TaxID=1173582 RepID=A0ABW3JI52_9FLAO
MKSFLLSLFISFSFVIIGSSQTNALKSSIARGQEIYTDFCVSCHLPNGKGVERVYPPLANSDYLKKNREASIKAIKFGLQGSITVNGKKYNSVMTPLGLSDDEIADVMNYISNTWGNKNDKIVTEAEVSKVKK